MPIEAPASAAIYCRISRDPEGEGVKVERQEAICRELAARHGLPVVEVYSDNDIGASDQTAKKKVRHDFQRMVADAKAGRFTHILAYSSSRLTRRMAELEILVELSEAHGIRFITEKSGQYDLSTAGGLTVARILAAVDAGESKTISERQKSTYRHNALQGLPKPHKQRPFGWKKDAVTIEPEEAALIRKGVEDLIKGKSLMSIGRQWEAAGVLTAAGKAEWSWQTLNRVLVGYRTAGIRTLTERVPGKPEKREPLRTLTGSSFAVRGRPSSRRSKGRPPSRNSKPAPLRSTVSRSGFSRASFGARYAAARCTAVSRSGRINRPTNVSTATTAFRPLSWSRLSYPRSSPTLANGRNGRRNKGTRNGTSCRRSSPTPTASKKSPKW